MQALFTCLIGYGTLSLLGLAFFLGVFAMAYPTNFENFCLLALEVFAHVTYVDCR
jgi:hypothetical protein